MVNQASEDAQVLYELFRNTRGSAMIRLSTGESIRGKIAYMAGKVLYVTVTNAKGEDRVYYVNADQIVFMRIGEDD